MDLEDRLSSTDPQGLADKATAEPEVVSKKKELPLRLFFGNGPRVHKKLCIAWGVTDRRCRQCGKVGQLVCFSPNFRKWTEIPVRKKRSVHCGLCGKVGHNRRTCLQAGRD
ncbi:uncharacterized protein LOC106758209 isoform X2 [Vigna radiata var. radiata]|uniref:Uncharacterized protein LOC106758209 isoform X2 n=1 Tax=Vigna radiata var. radiata TaxID=3916 RepID=A0A3Q0EZK8_VIGRR|nr:uncharacterized protein LOC106758209 isoform X2 [Vigna radiata var. radiata]